MYKLNKIVMFVEDLKQTPYKSSTHMIHSDFLQLSIWVAIYYYLCVVCVRTQPLLDTTLHRLHNNATFGNFTLQ